MTTEQRAVDYAISVIGTSSDWEEVGQALMNHDEFGPCLQDEWGDDYITGATNIVRRAERILGKRLPSGYSN